MNQTEICLWCNSLIQPIVVHGHSQCPVCKINIDPCCSGEQECLVLDNTASQEERSRRA